MSRDSGEETALPIESDIFKLGILVIFFQSGTIISLQNFAENFSWRQ